MQTNRLRYFAACNSEVGFHSFYSQVFSEDLAHIYIIKGGPGTGKSSLMRRVADRAEEKGYRVEEIYCSSDPASLDGILAYDNQGQNHFAVLDGTSPHVTEMVLPGARDEILYVGEFWASDRLREQREEIQCAMRIRSAHYRRLYRYLQAAAQCVRNAEDLLIDSLDIAKIKEAVSGILSKYPIGAGFVQKTMLTDAIGMSGRCHFPTFEQQAEMIFRVRDCGGTAHHLFEEIYQQAKRRHLEIWISYDPLIPSHINGVFLPTCRVAFVMSAEEALLTEEGSSVTVRRLPMRRFIGIQGLRNASSLLTTAQKCEERLMDAALSTLDEIKTIHFDLEKRYVSAMDFEKMLPHAERWLEKIFH